MRAYSLPNDRDGLRHSEVRDFLDLPVCGARCGVQGKSADQLPIATECRIIECE